ncbi:organic solute transporter subunit alpha-like [Asterias rubens]|uniref:organic solute transporter subunit alpha-like n=1 Tax=Asterias rubens TaxID=7604 RepID=UPI001454ED80|nr:organic solute transporter subunit alpha-like [Asterias rubens]
MSFLGITPVICNNSFDSSKETFYEELVQSPIYALITTFSCLACVSTVVLFLEACHFTISRVPRSSVANHRLNTVIILSIFPVFSVCCLPAILIPEASTFCLAMADLYYSFTMFKFIVLIVDYYGGHRKMLVKLAAENITFPLSVPMLCCFRCFKPVRLTRKSFMWLKVGVLQIAILKPLLTFTQAIMGYANLSLFIVDIVTVVTTLTAVTAMNMMGANSSMGELKEKYCLDVKSAMMSSALMMVSLQKSIIGIGTLFRPLGCIVPFSTQLVGNQWQAVVLLVESTIMTIPTLRYYRTADCNVVGVPPPLEEDEELEPRTGVGKMRKWVRRHTLM